MKKKITVLLLAMLFTIAFAVGGCASGNQNPAPAQETPDQPAQQQSEPVKLTVMYQNNGDTDNYKKWMDENISLFTQNNSNVTIESLSTVSGDEYLTKLNTEMAANSVDGVFQGWVSGRLEPFAKSGRIYEIGQDIDKDPTFKAFLNQEALKSTTFDGKTYAIPSTIQGEYVIYNKDVFDKLGLQEPQTYEDFLNIVKVCKENSIVPVVLCNKEIWTGTIPYMTIYARVAGYEGYENTIIKRTGKFTDPDFVKAAQILQEWVNMGVFEPGVNGVSYDEAESKFVSGQGAMWFIGSFINGTLDEKMPGKVGMFNFPTIPDGKGNQNDMIILPNQSIAISENCACKPEAVDFVKFAFSQDRQVALAKGGNIPCTNIQVDASVVSPLVTEFIDMMTQATSSQMPWDVPLGNYLGQELNNMTQMLYDGQDPVKLLEALQQAADNEPQQ